MSFSFVDPEDYPAIRAALDTSLDADVIPDETIELPVYLGIAESEVKQSDPDWQVHLTNPEAASHLKNASIFFCAALLALSAPRMILEYFGDYRYHRDVTDWKIMANALETRAASELALATGKSVGATQFLPSMFGVAQGGRGSERGPLHRLGGLWPSSGTWG